MTGSLKYFGYTDDTGKVRGILHDETGGEATAGAGQLFLSPLTVGARGLPIGLTLRGVWAETTINQVVRKKFFPVALIANWRALQVGDTINEAGGGLSPAKQWKITRKQSESQRGL